MKYGTGYNEYVYSQVPSGKKVLDVGCWAGGLGRELIRKKNCYVVGIDNDKDALELAKKNLNDVIRLDLEKYSNPKLKEKFDIIIFADVLEHLRDPIKTINIFSKFLTKEGCFLVSLPNVANINNRLNIFFGNWNYTNTGILDKTHLRFFTKKTVLKIFSEEKFKSKIVESTPGFSFLFFRYFNLLKRIRYYLCKIYPPLFAFQFIVKARLK